MGRGVKGRSGALVYHGAALVRELMRAATPRAQCTTQEHRLTHVIAATHFVAIARMVASVILKGGQRGSKSKVEVQDVKRGMVHAQM